MASGGGEYPSRSNGAFLTVDIETVPQARWVQPLDVQALREILDEDFYNDHSTEPEYLRHLVAEGQGVLKATGVAPSLHATTCHIVQVSFGWRSGPETICKKVLQSDHVPILTAGEPTCSDVHRVVADRCENCGMLFGLKLAERAEVGLLTEAMAIIQGACAKRTTIVTFNGKGFDLPVLRARDALLRIPRSDPPWRRLLYPYADDQHADLRLILSNDDRRAYGTLQHWAESFGIHAEEHGAEVYGWVRDGKWADLFKYGETEATTLVELYERVRPIL